MSKYKEIIQSILYPSTWAGEKVIKIFNFIINKLQQSQKSRQLQIGKWQLRIKPLTLGAISFLILFVPLVYFLTKNPKEAKAAWWNDGWLYRKKVEITNSGTNQTDFQVKVLSNFDMSSEVTNGKVQSDFDDLRFTDINGKLIPYWIEDNTSSSLDVWVKIPSIPTSGATLYLYYGNPSASSEHNGDQVFEIFHDFDNGLKRWAYSENGSAWSGDISTSQYVSSPNSYSINYPPATGSSVGYYGRISKSFTFDGAAKQFEVEARDSYGGGTSGYHFLQLNVDSTTIDEDDVAGDEGGWYTLSGNNTPSSGSHELILQIYDKAPVSGFTITGYFDNLKVRKYAATEPSAGTPGSEEQAPGPIAYWKFDEGYGTTTYDSTQNNNNGSLGTGSSAPEWQPESMCISGKCLSFDGSNDYVGLNSQNFSDTAYTLSLWFRTGTNSGIGLYTERDSGSPIAGQLYFTGGNLSFIVRNSAGQNILAQTATNYHDNQWHHASAVRNGTTVTLYVDGKQVATDTDSNVSSAISVGTYTIGSYQPVGGFFSGTIDEVKIYPYARNVDQIRSDYLRSAGAHGSSTVLGAEDTSFLNKGLVGYWKMDEASWDGTSDEVVDSSGNNNHGVGVGATPPTTGAGYFGNAGDFDGTDNHVHITDDSSLDITGDLTMSAWIKTDEANNGTIAGKWASNQLSYWFGLVGGSLRMYLSGSGTSAIYRGKSSSGANDNNWHHVVAVYNNNQTIKIYIDGLEQTLDESNGTIPASLHNGSANLQIARSENGGDNITLDGLIDEARIYNRTLSPSEIRALYNWAPGPIAHWKLDEKTGTSAYDTSGNSNTGTLTNSPTWTSGKFGGALDLERDNSSYVQTTLGQATLNGTYTVTAWFKRESLANSNAAFLISGGYGGNPAGVTVATDDFSGMTGVVAGGQSFTVSEAYKNGILQSGTSFTVNNGEWAYIALIGTVNDNTSSSTNHWLGANNNNTNHFDGIIDDLRIYNYARTSQQITQDMNAGHPAVGSPVGTTVGYWKFDEGYGSTVYDSSPQGNNGSLGTGSFAPSWTNSGKFGKALSFDGGDHINVSDSTSLDIASAITITAWVKADTWSNTYPRILEKTSAYQLVIEQSSEKVFFRIFDGGTPYGGAFDTILSDDGATWYHIAGTYDGSALKAYINGKPESTTYSHTGDIDTNNNDLTVGNNVTGGGLGFDGIIDDVKIYNSALTEDQVRLDYNQGKDLVMGAYSTDSSGNADWSSARSYCVPGDATSCSAPVGEWKFDEKTGISAYDTSDNSNTGTLTNSPTWTNGKFGGALSFDGSDNYVNLNNIIFSTSDGTQPYSASAWIKTSADGGIITQYTTADGNRFGLRILSNKLVYWKVSSLATSTKSINDNAWHYVAFTKDSSGSINLYIDGVTDGAGTDTNAFTNTNTVVGNFGSLGGIAAFSGLIDHVKIYDYALSQAQIAWDYNRGKPVGHWKLDECQGTTAYDSSDFSNNGNINIGATAPQTSVGTCTSGNSAHAWYNGVDGKYNSSLNFDGNDDLITITHSSSLNVPTAWTVSSWVKLAGDPSGNPSIFTDFYPGAESKVQFTIGFNGNTRALRVGFYNGSWYSSITTDLVPLSTWTHVVGVYDGSAGTIKVYINGVLSKTTTGVPSSIGDVTTDKRIGRRWDQANYINGQIDDVRIYNYALNTTQIKSLYNESSAVRYGPASGSP